MADISKCKGINCKLKKCCYRFTAPLGYWQAWYNHEHNQQTKTCDFYWEVETKKQNK